MSASELSAASRLHVASKEDQTSTNGGSFDIDARFRDFCGVLGLDPSDAGGKTTFVGEDPILPSRHRLGACISIPMMAAAAGAATIWRMAAAVDRICNWTCERPFTASTRCSSSRRRSTVIRTTFRTLSAIRRSSICTSRKTEGRSAPRTHPTCSTAGVNSCNVSARLGKHPRRGSRRERGGARRSSREEESGLCTLSIPQRMVEASPGATAGQGPFGGNRQDRRQRTGAVPSGRSTTRLPASCRRLTSSQAT